MYLSYRKTRMIQQVGHSTSKELNNYKETQTNFARMETTLMKSRKPIVSVELTSNNIEGRDTA